MDITMLSLTKIGFLLVAYQLAFIRCSCPNVKPVDNVDLDQWANGVWYDVAVTHNNYNEIFSSLAYNHIGDMISFNSPDLPMSDPNYVRGTGRVVSDGKMVFSFGIGDSSQDADMTVVALSDDILGLFGCINGDDSSGMTWLSTRQENPDERVRAEIQKVLDSYVDPRTNQKASWKTRI